MSTRRSDEDWSGRRREEPSLVEQITSLADTLAGTGVTDLELTEGDLSITLRRRPLRAVVTGPAAQRPAAGAATPEPPPTPAELSIAVLAPITGVFYTAMSPTADPFIQIGTLVQPGQVVCMVEAMKVFNEIKTEIGGTVVAIPPKNGHLVKKGDPLVRIKPA